MASKAVSANKAKINIIYYSMYGHVAASKFGLKGSRSDVHVLFFSSGKIRFERC